VTDIDDIRSRMHALTEQARRMLALHDAGAVRRAECLALAREMQQFHGQDDHGLLDLADRAEAIGDHRRAEELYQTAMEVEGELLQGAPPVTVG
jgi:hypothetical protein